jgi:hypothetical protein
MDYYTMARTLIVASRAQPKEGETILNLKKARLPGIIRRNRSKQRKAKNLNSSCKRAK